MFVFPPGGSGNIMPRLAGDGKVTCPIAYGYPGGYPGSGSHLQYFTTLTPCCRGAQAIERDLRNKTQSPTHPQALEATTRLQFWLFPGDLGASNAAPYKTPCRLRAPGGFSTIVVFGCFLVLSWQATLRLQNPLPLERPGRV